MEGNVAKTLESDFAEALRHERRTGNRLISARRRITDQHPFHRADHSRYALPILVLAGIAVMCYTGDWSALPFLLIGALFF